MLLNLLKARTHVQPQGHVSVKELPVSKGNINLVQTLYLHFMKTSSGLKTQFRVIFMKMPSPTHFPNSSLCRQTLGELCSGASPSTKLCSFSLLAGLGVRDWEMEHFYTFVSHCLDKVLMSDLTLMVSNEVTSSRP